MNLLTRLKSISQMVFSTSRRWQLFLPRTSYNYARDVGDGLRSSVLVAVVFWIMRRFAEAQMIMNIDEEVEDDHEVLSLLRRPNPFYSGRLLRMAMSLSYNLDGNAYALKIRNSQLKPVQLWYVPHWMLEPHWPQNGVEYIDYYNYIPQGVPIKISTEDVVHVRFGLDPDNVRKGFAPFKSLVREIFTDDEAANFTASLLRNFGMPGLIISPGVDDAMMDKDAPEAIKDFFKGKTGDKRGEPLVMKGKTTVEQFGFNPKELDLSKLREIPEERVCAVLGVHAAVVGFGTGMQQTKVGATMKELRESAYEDCIIPMQNTFAEELDIQLLPDFETDLKRFHVGFDLSNVRVLQEDENKHAKRVISLAESSLLTVAESRAELGYEVKPEHEVYLRRFNMLVVPAGNMIEEQPRVHNDDDNGDGDDKVYTVAQLKFIIPRDINVKTEQQAQLAQALLKAWQHLSDVWRGELIREFQALGREARKAWEQIVEERGVELAARVAEIKIDVDDIYAEFVMERMDCRGYIDYRPQYLRVAASTYDTVETVLGLGIRLTESAEATIAAAGGTRRGLLDLTQQTKDAVHCAIAEARAAGEGPGVAAMKIEKFVASGPWSTSEIRGEVIARTETKYAQNISSLDVYKTGGFTEVQIVDGQLGPDRSCDTCMDRDGTIMPINEAYALDEHPNGTLSWTPVMGGKR